jgi:signal transduction histidine kinase
MVHREPLYPINVRSGGKTFTTTHARAPSFKLGRTLRTRLVLAAAGSIVAAVALFAGATLVLVRHQLRASLDDALRTRAQEVAQLAVSAPAVLTDPGALEGPASARQVDIEVVDERGRIIARSLTLGAQLLPLNAVARDARLAGRPGFEDVEVSGRPFRLYATPIAQAGGAAAGGAVLAASDTSDVSDTIGHLGAVLTAAGLVVIVITILVAAALTRGSLRPLRRLAGAAGEIERTADPAARLPQSALDDEVAQLTGVLNRMLASLEHARAGERRFLADASHELRTPVAALLGNVEFVARHGAEREVVADLRRDVERLARLVDDLLVLERAGAGIVEAEPVELADVVSSVVDEHPSGRVIAERVEPVEVLGERGALTRVVENLVENGLVHGPPEGRVAVSLIRQGDHAALTVRDEGPGPDASLHDRLFERFWRGSDAAGRSGSGLGLSIVAAIVERHGGRIAIEGSAFTVTLPQTRELSERNFSRFS